MKQVEIVATRKARSMRAGQRKMMRADQARVLVMIGHATYAEEAQPAPRATKRAYHRRDMVPQPAPAGPVGAMTAPMYPTKTTVDDV